MKAIKNAKILVHSDVSHDTVNTLNEVKKCLHDGVGVTKVKTLQEKVKFIFSGGGCSDFPYNDSVSNTFKKYINYNHDLIVTSMPYPEDFRLSDALKKYISRFYVAYGLSFPFDDLVDCSYPSANKLVPLNSSGNLECTCRGRNKNCINCHGTGIIDN